MEGAFNELLFSSSDKINTANDLDTQSNELRALGIAVVDQFSIERNVEEEVDKAVVKHTRKQKIQMIKREIRDLNLESRAFENKKSNCESRLMDMQQRLTDPRRYLDLEKELKEKIKRQKEILERGAYLHEKLVAAEKDEEILDDVDLELEEGEILEEEGNFEGRATTSEKAKLIEAGEMTPFGTVMNAIPGPSSISSFSSTERKKERSFKADTEQPLNSEKNGIFQNYLQDQINKQKKHFQVGSEKRKNGDPSYGIPKKKSKKLKEFIGNSSLEVIDNVSVLEAKQKSPLKMKILHPKCHWKEKNLGSQTSELDQNKRPGKLLSEVLPFDVGSDQDASESGGSDYIPDSDEHFSDEGENMKPRKFFGGIVLPKDPHSEKREPLSRINPTKKKQKVVTKKIIKTKDDAYLEDYQERIQIWKRNKLLEASNHDDLSDDEDEFEQFDGGYKIPLSVWNNLFKYQKIGVKWLWELHNQGCGGILGDEMGLGKTIQVISFLVGLSFSGLSYRDCDFKGLGPVLIISPATVLHQWVKEFHKWWPKFRVAVLHGSGVFTGKRNALIHNINRFGGILVTSYTGVRAQLNTLLQYKWHYVILDEGHKIRNPEAQITVAVKRFETIHRLILSGSPIQNSLKELWSLFDFIFPGKLGSLQVFMQQFSVPITQGGYANATKLQVQTAYKCATVLRDTINPYLLRRMKNDVRKHLTLPDKNEQVLFCGLTEEQRNIYKQYLDSDHVENIMKGRLQVFVGLINLRKICNHPDLYTKGPRTSIADRKSDLQPELQYGWWQRSGKMAVLEAVLKLWSKQSHRVLLFTQSRQMMCILEKFIQDQSYSYFKMDGATAVSARQPLIDRFNGDPSVFIFLLTTRVGGLGVNLTGADRVIIFDPDWNPSTDTQARERAWRIGQLRHVTIYRLLTSGTIEEKIYHRQIFKQFLTNRILKDPKQQRFFKTNDLYELFTLHEGIKEKNESSALFAGTGSEIKVASKSKDKDNKKSKEEGSSYDASSSSNKASTEKVPKESKKGNGVEAKVDVNVDRERILKLAKMLSKKIVEKKGPNENDIPKKNSINGKLDDSHKKVKDKNLEREKKKHKKGKRFEGERIELLVKKRKYKNKDEEESNSLEGKGNKNQDEYVLKKLFKGSGVHTALSHDIIVNTSDPDYLLLETEADRVAKEAMRQVRASRRQCLNPRRERKSVQKPLFGTKKNSLIDDSKGKASSTLQKQEPKPFNGLFSMAGEDECKPSTSKGNGTTAISKPTLKFGTGEMPSGALSSSQLLLRMKQRNQDSMSLTAREGGDDNASEDESLPLDPETRDHVELLTDIRNFVAFQSEENGKASTQEVVTKFKERLPSDKTHIFKALLNEICDFRRDSSGIGFWHLKGEFR